jgi:hypothetical protein
MTKRPDAVDGSFSGQVACPIDGVILHPYIQIQAFAAPLSGPFDEEVDMRGSSLSKKPGRFARGMDQ